VNPSKNPIRSEPCVTTCERGREVASASNFPFTIFRSGAMLRRYSYVGLSVRLPKQRVWPILPGVRSFLNCDGGFSRWAEYSRVQNGPLRECPELGLGYGGRQ
jgi:hypothetical protein